MLEDKNERVTVATLKKILNGMEGSSELPVLVKNYDYSYNNEVYSVRKVVETNEENEVTDAYILING